ncbi:CPBP family intramembrane glutamic endopeptidase [Chitinilyticum litopenaei]|uniref:CPBP family intramembrane glutamic endopeptidase n=1 Tax=Chitinilyticum litopenaei TaxID=1121276 RepID=UPI00041C7C1B|nr:CPBP family intramembrane glutamic endopeptidase [Chitinilyticum litopenaei]
MLLLPWLALFGAALLALAGAGPRHWCWPLLAALLIAAAQGRLGWPTLLPMLLLAVAVWLARQPQHPWRAAGHALLLCTGLGLALHAFPGFANLPLWQQLVLSPGAQPATFFLNLDKPLLAFALLLVCPLPAQSWRSCGLAVLRCLPLTLLLVMPPAFALGLIAWAPPWQAGRWPLWPLPGGWWLLNNLLLVCLVEELLFRGWLMQGLARYWAGWRHGAALALILSALLFGLAHAAGGPVWVLVATLAGLGYGVAWRAGGLRAAVGVHFGVNAVHLLAFSYPQLAG